MDKGSLRRHGTLNENHSTRHKIHYYELLGREAPDILKTTQVVAIALVYPS